MNKFFIGKAMGVKEPKEKILPAALENKTYAFDKEQHNKDKFSTGKTKMKEFNAKMPNQKMDFFTQKKSNVTMGKKFNFSSMTNQKTNNTDKLKSTSDLFLNTNYKGGAEKHQAFEKMSIFMNKQPQYKQDTNKVSNINKILANTHKFKLPVKDHSSRNATYDGMEVYDTTATNTNLSGQGIDWSNLEADRAATAKESPIITVVPNAVAGNEIYREQPTATNTIADAAAKQNQQSFISKLGNKLSTAYENTDYAQQRAFNKDVQQTAKQNMMDPKVKESLVAYEQVKRYNQLLDKYNNTRTPTQSVKSALSALAYSGKAATSAIGNIAPPISTDKFNKLAGFVGGSRKGLEYMSQASLPRQDAGYKLQLFTGGLKNRSGTNMLPPQPMVAQMPMPKYGGPETMDVKQLQKAYLKAIIEKRLSSSKPIGERGMRDLENKSMQIQRLGGEVEGVARSRYTPRVSEQIPEQQQVTQQPVQAQPQKIVQEMSAGDSTDNEDNSKEYKVKKPHPNAGKQVVINGEVYTYSVYGHPVKFFRTPYNTKNK
jgi:hypothetical protein